MKILEQYLNYLHERDWIDPTEYPDSFHNPTFKDMIQNLNIKRMKKIRHALQPSMYNIYVKNFLGDYRGRPDTMNSQTIRNVGYEDFESDIPAIKKRIAFAKKIKDKMPPNFFSGSSGHGETNDPGGEDSGDGGNGGDGGGE